MSNVIVQLEIIIGLYSWVNCLARAAEILEIDTDKIKPYIKEAVHVLEKLLVDRKKAEQGKWKDWYRGEKKMNLLEILARTKSFLN